MDYLVPPAYNMEGWVTLSSLTTPWIGNKLKQICSALDAFTILELRNRVTISVCTLISYNRV